MYKIEYFYPVKVLVYGEESPDIVDFATLTIEDGEIVQADGWSPEGDRWCEQVGIFGVDENASN